VGILSGDFKMVILMGVMNGDFRMGILYGEFKWGF